VGAPFTLRGVEAEVVGRLGGTPAAPTLESSVTGETLRLAPLTGKVQWDARAQRVAAPRRTERRAYAKLVAQWDGSGGEVRIVGPLRAGQAGARPILEVREFDLARGSR